jgi:hypothetical protein
MRRIVPAGIMTLRPKIHGPVSTTSHERPVSLVASSILPIEPSRASTLNPVRSGIVPVPITSIR